MDLLSLAHARALGTMSWAELLGALTGLSCVYLMTRQHVASWPLGLVNNALFFLLFWHNKLYAAAVLQIVFGVLAGYGWWKWTGHLDQPAVRVRRTPRREWAWLVAFVVLSGAATALHLTKHTDSPAPIWDASVLALSLAATYGQARKRLESWYLWILVDLCSVPLYLWRELYPTAGVYVIYLVLCVLGLKEWSRALHAAESEAAERVS